MLHLVHLQGRVPGEGGGGVSFPSQLLDLSVFLCFLFLRFPALQCFLLNPEYIFLYQLILSKIRQSLGDPFTIPLSFCICETYSHDVVSQPTCSVINENSLSATLYPYIRFPVRAEIRSFFFVFWVQYLSLAI